VLLGETSAERHSGRLRSLTDARERVAIDGAGGIEAEARSDELIEKGLEGREAAIEAGADEHADGADERQLLLERKPAERGVIGDDQDTPVPRWTPPIRPVVYTSKPAS